MERALAQPAPAEEAPSAEEAPPAEAPAPRSEDTQVHDMAKELEIEPEEPSAAPADPADAGDTETSGEGEPALELDVEELDIDLDDELDLEEPKDEGAESQGDDGEDVLEETPEFLRDAPESDRLWFEQGKPKDFDFDEE